MKIDQKALENILHRRFSDNHNFFDYVYEQHNESLLKKLNKNRSKLIAADFSSKADELAKEKAHKLKDKILKEHNLFVKKEISKEISRFVLESYLTLKFAKCVMFDPDFLEEVSKKLENYYNNQENYYD